MANPSYTSFNSLPFHPQINKCGEEPRYPALFTQSGVGLRVGSSEWLGVTAPRPVGWLRSAADWLELVHKSSQEPSRAMSKASGSR